MTVTPISAQDLRERVEDAYSNMADLAASMKGMAFLAGVLTACDLVAALREAAVDDKTTEMHLPTLTEAMDRLRKLAMASANGTIIMERAMDVDERPPPGTKFS